ncbi:hypothetical protein [Catelliglobosispora koreensis]|uniref:hypothetical protein n=1 Tax=Catelliglobosispora koreensis TaxID=129052 RepID=UPI0003749F88|nr:hypothetical protein [Catelliglobosispora koreensis]
MAARVRRSRILVRQIKAAIRRAKPAMVPRSPVRNVVQPTLIPVVGGVADGEACTGGDEVAELKDVAAAGSCAAAVIGPSISAALPAKISSPVASAAQARQFLMPRQ